MVRSRAYTVRLAWSQRRTRHGCRACGQSQDWIPPAGPVVAVLDVDMIEPQLQRGDELWVNWLQHRAIFDFDTVIITEANDADVERFAMHLGNDTVPWRQRRYRTMDCTIAPDCGVSSETQRFLQRLFGHVNQGEIHARSSSGLPAIVRSA